MEIGEHFKTIPAIFLLRPIHLFHHYPFTNQSTGRRGLTGAG